MVSRHNRDKSPDGQEVVVQDNMLCCIHMMCIHTTVVCEHTVAVCQAGVRLYPVS